MIWNSSMIDLIMIGVGLVFVLSVALTFLKKKKRAVYASRRHTFQKNRRLKNSNKLSGDLLSTQESGVETLLDDNCESADYEELDVLGLKSTSNKTQEESVAVAPSDQSKEALFSDLSSTAGDKPPNTSEVNDKVQPENNEVFNKIPELIVCHLITEDNQFYQGHELLQALLASGLCYGDMQIFHYGSSSIGDKSQHLFSCAQLTNPGTFDIQNMGACQIEGLTLFFSVKESLNPVLAYEQLIKTINQLKESLGGNLYNDEMKNLTQNDIDSNRLCMARALSIQIQKSTEQQQEIGV